MGFTRSATTSGLLALWIVVLSCFGAAQPKPRPSITFNIPFEFVLGNRVFPAGTYTLEPVLGPPTELDHINVLVLRSLGGTTYHAVVTDVVNGEVRVKSTLVFASSGGQRFLSQVWQAGQHVGLKIHLPGSTGGVEEEREKHEIVELQPPLENMRSRSK
jgi:hypothetical protein